MSFKDKVKKMHFDFCHSDPKNRFKGHTMGWYKALLFCVIPLTVIMYFFTAISRLFGWAYHEEGHNVSEAVYILAKGLKAVDIIYGLICLFLIAFSVLVWRMLRFLKKDAAKMLHYFYEAAFFADLLYLFFTIITIPSEARSEFISWFYVIFRLLLLCVVALVNKAYFAKRKDIFVR